MAASIAPLRYQFPVDAMLKGLKFHNRVWVGPAMAEVVVPHLEEHQFDVITPLPLHRWRHGIRGYNQAAEIARPLGRSCQKPVRHLLRRVRRTRPQSGLDASSRRKNLRGAFKARATLMPESVLLVDDVMTTGATLNEAAATLRRAGVDTVIALTIARA